VTSSFSEADLLPGSPGRRHQLPQRVENGFELRVVALLQLVQPADQVRPERSILSAGSTDGAFGIPFSMTES
jgi:hypothetical protein